jgi:sulfide dehydrogenase cytochrome subunit
MSPIPSAALRSLTLAAGLLGCAAAAAQTPSVLPATLAAAAPATVSPAERQVRTWAATCAACHGTEGRDQGAIPAIAGRGAETLYRALIEFKAGQRPAATVMHQHAKGYSDDELRRLAQYFAALPVR